MAHVVIEEDTPEEVYAVGGTLQDTFAVPFPFFALTDIKVYVDGALLDAADYTVTGNATDGGYDDGEVVLDTAVSNATVKVLRDTPTERTEDFPYPSNTLNIKALNTALDKIAAWAQQLKLRFTRALRQPDGDTATIAALPAAAARAGKLLGFDANGDPAASAVVFPSSISGAALSYMRVNAGETAYEHRTPAQVRSDIGADNASNLASGTVADARLPTTMAGKTLTGATLSSPTVTGATITGGSVGSLATDLAVADGGTGASDAGGARTSLGLAAGGAGDIWVEKAGDTMTGKLTLDGDPASALHAATKQYVDAAILGVNKRGQVDAATTAGVTLSGEQTIDGVALSAGDLVLVKNQTAQEENGVYAVAAGAWARDSHFDSFDTLAGALIVVERGATNADTMWMCTANDGGTLGVTAVTFTSVYPGAGGTVTQVATTEGITTGDGNPISSTGTLQLDVDGLTEDTAPDLGNDFVPSWDASAGAHRKVKLQNIGGTAVSAQSGNFNVTTTPNTLYVVSDTAVATLPSAGDVATGFKATFKNATDGKGVTIARAGSDTIDGLTSYRVPGRSTVELTRTAAATWTVTREPPHMVGEVIEWGTDTLPDGGWVWNNGTAISRTTYKGLFDVWGTTYGAGDASTTFNVRDDRGRVKAGHDTMAASAASRLTSAGSGVDGATLGAAGGSQTHTLTTAQLASHSHSYEVGGGGGSGGNSQGTPSSGSTGSAGSGQAHNNTQPTIVTNFIVKT